MKDTQIYIAYLFDGTQLLRHAFEHPIVENWLEEDQQRKLQTYFSEHHHSHMTPFTVEPSEIMDYTPYRREL